MDTEFTPPIENYSEEMLKDQHVSDVSSEHKTSDHHFHNSAKKQSPVALLVLLILILAIPVTAFVLSSRSQVTDDRSRAAALYPPTPTSTSQCQGAWIPVAGVGCCPGGSDICSTVGATQCNGNILAECKVFNSACPAANRNYWAGVGSCTIGDPSNPNCISWTAADLGSGGSCVTGSYSCPGQTSYGSGCNLNGTRSVSNAPGQICLPNKLTCGVEQIDVNCTSTGFRFKSRMYTSTCAVPPAGTATPLPPASTITPAPTSSLRPTSPPTGLPTSTPTKPIVSTATPTKPVVISATPTKPVVTSTTGTLTCQKLEAYLGTVNVTTNLGQIKYGDVVTFKGYANQTNTVVKSLSFQMTIAGVAQPILTVPATLETGIYTAKFQYTFTTVGAHIVKVISINK